MNPEFIALGFLWYIAFLFSLTCHEASHALAAKWGGDLTAAEGGQVTLNPLPHIRREIFGTMIVPILSYVMGGWMIGWGSAPFDPHWRNRHPHRAAWMALAGPAANFILMLAAVLAIRIGIFAGALVQPESARFTQSGGGGSSRTHGGCGDTSQHHVLPQSPARAFQLAPHSSPGRPRGHLFVFHRKFCPPFTAATRNPSLAMLGLIVGWKVFGYLLRSPIPVALNILYPGAGYH